ncbi:MAG TPA: hypothetical protein DC064_11115 [Cyanobacteria bacterium UBA9273]|nr:hypothetical protein [Cyanobacteria bacterium UBA9273]
MGFINDLFGLKTKYVDEETDFAELAAEQEKRQAFFLNPDEAKTMGNIEFMRSPIQQKSAKKQNSQQESPQPLQQPSVMKVTPEPQPPADQNNQVNQETRSTDSNMDIFRQMARQMRKS